MHEGVAEKVVELFEDNKYRCLKDVLKIVKSVYHLSGKELIKVKELAENLLTYEMLEPERLVDVC